MAANSAVVLGPENANLIIECVHVFLQHSARQMNLTTKIGLLFHDQKVYRSELTITWKRHDIPINVPRPRPLTVLCFDLYYESNMYLLTEREDCTGK